MLFLLLLALVPRGNSELDRRAKGGFGRDLSSRRRRRRARCLISIKMIELMEAHAVCYLNLAALVRVALGPHLQYRL